jgi:hypothetical protein
MCSSCFKANTRYVSFKNDSLYFQLSTFPKIRLNFLCIFSIFINKLINLNFCLCQTCSCIIIFNVIVQVTPQFRETAAT